MDSTTATKIASALERIANHLEPDDVHRSGAIDRIEDQLADLVDAVKAQTGVMYQLLDAFEGRLETHLRREGAKGNESSPVDGSDAGPRELTVTVSRAGSSRDWRAERDSVLSFIVQVPDGVEIARAPDGTTLVTGPNGNPGNHARLIVTKVDHEHRTITLEDDRGKR